MNDMVATNIGLIPKEDYLDIMAMQYGFESYEDLKKSGFEISVKGDVVHNRKLLVDILKDKEGCYATSRNESCNVTCEFYWTCRAYYRQLQAGYKKSREEILHYEVI